MPLEAAVVMVALPERPTVPEIEAVRSDVLNEPRMAPCVPLLIRPLPAIVKLLASAVAFLRATEPLPLTSTLPVPNALLLNPSATPFAAVLTCAPVTYVMPEYVLLLERKRHASPATVNDPLPEIPPDVRLRL